jgi:DNA invertase Pin-like site-specific DNA recombinase
MDMATQNHPTTAGRSDAATSDLPAAVAYFRMSTDKQDTSIEQQRGKVPSHFAAKYRVVEAYTDEGKSGSKDTEKRTDFLRMVADLTEGKYKGLVKTVLCLDLSRFGHLDSIAGAEHKERLRRAGVRLDTVIDGLIDWNTATGRIVDSVKSEGNHQLALLIAEKGLAGRIRATQRGRPNQTTPYGMAKKVTSPTGEQTVVGRCQRFATPKTWRSEFCPGDVKEAGAMRFAFETFDREDLSWNELARRMDAAGFPPPGAAGEWHGDTLCWMLRNPVLAGGLRIGQIPKGKFFRTSAGRETAAADAEAGGAVVVWNCHEGVVSRELFDRVQQKVARNFKARGRSRRAGPYALTGVVFCGGCGRPMYGSKDARGLVHYRCHRAEVAGRAPCGYWLAWEKDLLPYVQNDFLKHIGDRIDELVRMPPPAAGNGPQGELAKIERKLANARQRFLEASPQVAKGLLPLIEQWEREREELAKKLDAPAGEGEWRRVAEAWVAHLRRLAESTPVVLGEGDEAAQAGAWGDALFPPAVLDVLEKDQPGGIAFPDKGACRVVPAAALREALKKIDARVTVWFRPKGKGRGYDLDKARLQATVGGPLCNGEASNAAS